MKAAVGIVYGLVVWGWGEPCCCCPGSQTRVVLGRPSGCGKSFRSFSCVRALL